jgi:hypothetical protein
MPRSSRTSRVHRRRSIAAALSGLAIGVVGVAPPRFRGRRSDRAGEVPPPAATAPPGSPPRAARTPSPSSRATRACASPTFRSATHTVDVETAVPGAAGRPSRSTATCTCCRSRRCRTSRPGVSTATSSTSRLVSSTARRASVSARPSSSSSTTDVRSARPLPGASSARPRERRRRGCEADHATAASTWSALTRASGHRRSARRCRSAAASRPSTSTARCRPRSTRACRGSEPRGWEAGTPATRHRRVLDTGYGRHPPRPRGPRARRGLRRASSR